MSITEKNKADRKETQDPPTQNLGSTVNTTGYKRNIRNFVIFQLTRVYAHITRDRQKRYLFRKIITCLLYGEMKLSKYISDKRMNCFIWKDCGADEVYTNYIALMDKVYEQCTIEIITKE